MNSNDIKQTVTYQLHIIKLLSFLIIALAVFAFIVHVIKPKQTYFARNPAEGITHEILSLDQPNVTTKGLLRWASFAITSIYTLDFVHYEETIEEIREHFTSSGYKNYMDQLASKNKLVDIAEQKLVVTAVLYGTPTVVSESIVKGRYTWNVNIPLLITYQGASEVSSQELKLITALVIRDPKSEKGIGIAQILERDLRIS